MNADVTIKIEKGSPEGERYWSAVLMAAMVKDPITYGEYEVVNYGNRLEVKHLPTFEQVLEDGKADVRRLNTDYADKNFGREISDA